jgi:hypothetical protein
MQSHDPAFINARRVPTASLTLACICTATLAFAWPWGIHRIVTALRSHKPWCDGTLLLTCMPDTCCSTAEGGNLLWTLRQGEEAQAAGGHHHDPSHPAGMLRVSCMLHCMWAGVILQYGPVFPRS